MKVSTTNRRGGRGGGGGEKEERRRRGGGGEKTKMETMEKEHIKEEVDMTEEGEEKKSSLNSPALQSCLPCHDGLIRLHPTKGIHLDFELHECKSGARNE
eukprot:439711-Hanusia_phi.AAC.1